MFQVEHCRKKKGGSSQYFNRMMKVCNAVAINDVQALSGQLPEDTKNINGIISKSLPSMNSTTKIREIGREEHIIPIEDPEQARRQVVDTKVDKNNL